jgi:alpha-L-rhamnosidase
VEREWQILEKVMKWFLDRRTDRGLVNAREFFLHFDNPLAFQVCEGATLNAFVYGSLIDAAWLATKLGKKEQAKQFSAAARELTAAYNKYFWDESAGTYFAGLKKGEKKLLTPWAHEPWKAYYATINQSNESFPPTVQAAVMALSRGLVPVERLASVQKYLFEHHFEFVSPFSYLFAFEAFYKMNTSEADQEAINTMRKRWSVMVARKMPGTLGEQFDDKSYYCHDFGPIPSAFLGSYVMGVRRDGPVENKRIIIEPRLGDLTEVKGVVVTRHGPVAVAWKRMMGGQLNFKITIPDGVTASVSIPRPSIKPILTIDGKTERSTEETNRFLIVELAQGEHTGTISP